MSLLFRNVAIIKQPTTPNVGIRLDRRPSSRRVLLTRWRQRRRQRLAHRAPMNTVTLGPLPNRQTLDPSIPADRLEKLHARPHTCDLHVDKPDVKIASKGGANIRDDTPHPTNGHDHHTSGDEIRLKTTARTGANLGLR